MQSVKLYYFNLQARAEIIRLILHYGGVTFEDIRYELAKWPELKDDKKWKYGQLPILEIDGKTLAQSQTIARYLCQRLGYYPTDLDQATQVEELREFINSDISDRQYLGGLFKDQELKEQYRKEYFETKLPKNLAYLEERLANNTTGFLFGDSITIADFTLVDFAQRVLYDKDWIDRTKPVLEKLPNLTAYLQKRFEDPKYKAYLEKKPKA